jgi:hypothetical protein
VSCGFKVVSPIFLFPLYLSFSSGFAREKERLREKGMRKITSDEDDFDPALPEFGDGSLGIALGRRGWLGREL